MNYDEWFESLNKNGRITYFLGQEGKVSKEAWDYQQRIIDSLLSQINEALDAFEDGEFNYCHKTLMKALGDKE